MSKINLDVIPKEKTDENLTKTFTLDISEIEIDEIDEIYYADFDADEK